MFLARPPAGKLGLLATAAPYPERDDHPETRVDAALLTAWGRISPYLISGVERRRLARFVKRVEDHEQSLIGQSDESLRGGVDQMRRHLLTGSVRSNAVALAFAYAREAAQRHIGMRHFHVQLLGGAAMMTGALAEMQTGEGKTLTALLPAATWALMGRPVHVVTVNDYLAHRDAQLLGPVYKALGLTVGLIQHGQDPKDRQKAYGCDVIYCTNKELVFDYLRDRLVLGPRRARARLLIDGLFNTSVKPTSQRLLLRGLQVAIVDEADSVLIDEARTPLILSGPQNSVETDVETLQAALEFARSLVQGRDFDLLQSEKRIRLTEQGKNRVAQIVTARPGIWAIRQAREELVQNALAAIHVYQRDIQYIIANGTVQIVDEYTGRVMPDRSWERGIHQLIEIKEDCALTRRNQTLARITYQRFFRRYLHLSGMTGTAVEAAGELRSVYGLRVVRIPPNRPLRRSDLGTKVHLAADSKWNAVVNSAVTAQQRGQAVLIGTRSVGASEHVGKLLLNAGLTPVILNARQDQQEAEIISRAGSPGSITVATNMAGRGTDIKLHPAVQGAGGLHVILTEYHESSRIDRQLFGRAGRQGDLGSFEAIVGLDDDLFQRFVGRRLLRLVGNGLHSNNQTRSTIARILKSYSQFAAEWLHVRNRRVTLREDHRFNKSIGFAGAD
jgi:preprotein translocase subunit SecA